MRRERVRGKSKGWRSRGSRSIRREGSRAGGRKAKTVTAGAAAQAERHTEGGAKPGVCKGGAAGAGGDHAAGAKQESVREAREDFLDVVRDENEGGAVFAAGETAEKSEKILAGDRIEAGAGFVEDEQARTGHQGAGDENALAFALGEKLPLAVEETRGTEQAEEFFRGGDVGAGGGEPEIELGVAAADDGLQGGLGGRDAGLERAGDDPELEAEFAPIGFAVAVAEDRDVAGAGREVAEEGFEQSGFAAAVGAQDRPVLAAPHAPIEAGKDDGVAAGHAQTGNIKDQGHKR